MITLLLLIACHRDKEDSALPALDLTEVLGAGEARAGVVTDEAALLGGVSAEGRLGDLKLYNSEVQFIIQDVRESAYYISYGGGLLDADVIRGPDEPGRDLVDEYAPMVGLGRILVADSVRVEADGSDGGPAIIVTEGSGGPFTLITGALESPELVPDREVRIETRYVLEPGSPLLQVTTTATWEDRETTAILADLFLLGLEVSDVWIAGRGLEGETPDTFSAMSALAWKNEVAFSVFPDGDAFVSSPLTDVLSEAAPVLAPVQGTVTLNSGDTTSWTTWVGVGRDPAALATAWAERTGLDTEALGGQVSAGDVPVAGARVHLLDVDGLPIGQAWTDEDGRWSATAPPGEVVEVIASGRGHAIHTDLPEGAGWYGPYAAETPRALSLASIQDGAPAAPFAEGYGISDAAPAGEDVALSLSEPGWLTISTGDGLPAVARVAFAASDAVGNLDALIPGRPDGLSALVFLRDGEATIPLEPGEVEVTVHRGLRWELDQQTLTVGAGETVPLTATLTEAYAPEDVWVCDPHSHASPSGDGGISMEDRLVVTAAHGVDLHFGTDHDHIADYRPLLAPLGLDGVLGSVVANEVSPVLRGHFNAWPLEVAPDAINQGAVLWWEGVESTESLFTAIRAMADDLILSANHPTGSSGLFGHAEYNLESGSIGETDRWSERFDAMEVLNDGAYDEYLPYYLDLVNRGYTPLPVGVSDSHNHRSGMGHSVTFLHHAPGAEPTHEALLAAAKAGAAVVSRGPYIQASVAGQPAPGQLFIGAQTLDVTVWAPSWIALDTLSLLRDGVVIETVALEGSAAERGSASFSLAPEADASYVLIASGGASMAPAYAGETPWAMAAAVRIDLDGDGWDAPLPPLVVGD